METFNLKKHMSILEKDTQTRFPHFIVLKASAGSGKTHTLTQRYVQIVLSDKIQRNHLRNILAITFSNNAAKEMKERVLQWLKALHFEDEKAIRELTEVITFGNLSPSEKAGRLIDEILAHYADFQIRTIDSFMATIFKASAIDFGYAPDFEILIDSDSLMEYAFNLYLKEVKEGSGEAALFDDMVQIILQNQREETSYLWDPSAIILEEIKEIHRRVAASGKEVRVMDRSGEIDSVEQKITRGIEKIEASIEKSGLERSGNSAFTGYLAAVREGRFVDLIGGGLVRPPVKKPKKSEGFLREPYDAVCRSWAEMGPLIQEYASLYARSYFVPYLWLYEAFSTTLNEVKKRQGKVFIEDINKRLSEYLRAEIVPDIYCRLGETIFHFLIDEFQDTAPIQWHNLLPLIGNVLAQEGSLFVVGDTKQAIYGFRDADYTIMKGCERRNPFPSALHQTLELETNYRSASRILEFNEEVFKKRAANHAQYRVAAEQSGLKDYVQRPQKRQNAPGYVQVERIERDASDPPERLKVQTLIAELAARGYPYRDIAILTSKNREVVDATTWLSEKDIPFISYSSLDIRRRKATGEIIALLRFFDSPLDDLAFATFLLGEIFKRNLEQDFGNLTQDELHEFLFRNRKRAPLYKIFQDEWGQVWERFFSKLFRSVGYLPLYDLVTETLRTFRAFETLEEDEATLVKILEAVKEFEGSGSNSLKDFLSRSVDAETGAGWKIDVPRNVNAVHVMTIHKAKGLGFPVVIVILYGASRRAFDYIIDEEGDEIILLKLNKKITDSAPSLKGRYDEEGLKETVNRLNSLYVGFTRAKAELYVIGVQGKRESQILDLLPQREFPPLAKPERIQEDSVGMEMTPPLVHPAGSSQADARPSEREKLTPEERRRGELIHRILASIEYTEKGWEGGIPQVIRRVSNEMRVERDPDEIRGIILGILDYQVINELFIRKPEREILREKEFVDPEGRLFRMDRVVLDRDRIVLLDWKTGKEKDSEKEHEAQLRTYLKIIQEVYPGRNLEGWIVYVDLKIVRRIR
jgi:ATP-dependent helicase/nuclease subunit A